jgi:hypothetical protein
LRSARFSVLEELVAMNSVRVEERQYEGKKRYLAVAERDSDMVCELTKGAFDAIVKTDVVERQKGILKKRKERGRYVIHIDERTGKPATTALGEAGKILWEGKRRKDFAKLSELLYGRRQAQKKL